MEKKTILIVDDAEIIRKQIREIVQPHNFEVLEAQDGMAGIQVCEATPHLALIISDVNMPIMDGLTMAQQLKKKPDFKTPIIMLTTEASREMKEEGKKIGVRGWVLKPFDPVNFLNVIKLLISTPSK